MRHGIFLFWNRKNVLTFFELFSTCAPADLVLLTWIEEDWTPPPHFESEGGIADLGLNTYFWKNFWERTELRGGVLQRELGDTASLQPWNWFPRSSPHSFGVGLKIVPKLRQLGSQVRIRRAANVIGHQMAQLEEPSFWILSEARSWLYRSRMVLIEPHFEAIS